MEVTILIALGSLIIGAIGGIVGVLALYQSRRDEKHRSRSATAREFALLAEQMERALHLARNPVGTPNMNAFEDRTQRLEKPLDLLQEMRDLNIRAKVDLDRDFQDYINQYAVRINQLAGAIHHALSDEHADDRETGRMSPEHLDKMHDRVYGTTGDEIGREITSITTRLTKALKKFI